MVKKALSYAVVPLLVMLFVFGIRFVTLKSQALPTPSLPSKTIHPGFPTLMPSTADISGEFTDPNFKKEVWKWLGKTGDPGTFSHLDILNKIASGVTALYVSSKEISSLKGLEYFEGITYFGCSSNKLTSLPALPSTLVVLACNNNQITSLPALPATLTHLECNNNKLTTLPDLPSTLGYLDCAFNDITVLPAIPSEMEMMFCEYNKLTEIPTLPLKMQVFRCIGNKIRTINIPNNLRTLQCDENMLTNLPALPDTLLVLTCESNQLVRLPALPGSLRDINVTENNLTENIITLMFLEHHWGMLLINQIIHINLNIEYNIPAPKPWKSRWVKP